MQRSDLIINGHIITWEQTAGRVIFYCSADKIAETESLVEEHLKNWAAENNIKFVNMASAAKLIAQRKQLLIDYPVCPDCPQYTGPSKDEIHKSCAFEDIEDKQLRWLLAQSFYIYDPEDDDTEPVDYWGKLVLYFPGYLFKAQLNSDKPDLSGIAKGYWRASHTVGPAFTVYDEADIQNWDHWDKNNPLYGIRPGFSLICTTSLQERSDYK